MTYQYEQFDKALRLLDGRLAIGAAPNYNLVVCGGTAVLVVTGFINPVQGLTISGWLLLIHVLLGAVFAVALLGLIVFRAAECSQPGSERFGLGQKIGFWMLATFGFGLLLTAALATLPVFGMCWQSLMASLHLYMGVGAVLATLVYLVGSIRKRSGEKKA